MRFLYIKALTKAPEVLHSIGVNILTDVLGSVVDQLMLVAGGKSIVGVHASV